jgi:hypothetical protein
MGNSHNVSANPANALEALDHAVPEGPGEHGDVSPRTQLSSAEFGIRGPKPGRQTYGGVEPFPYLPVQEDLLSIHKMQQLIDR